MKSKILFPLFFFAGLMFVSMAAYPYHDRTPDNKTVIQQGVKYTCPNHPEVVQDVPGTCPKCGMALVEKKEMTTVDMLEKTAKKTFKNGKGGSISPFFPVSSVSICFRGEANNLYLGHN
jgi:hypothetical protein